MESGALMNPMTTDPLSARRQTIRSLKALLLVVIAVFLTVSTFIFGAIPMRVLREVYGRMPYWTSLLASSALLAAFVSPSYGLLVLSLTVAVGAYAEVEEHGDPVFWAGFGAVLAAIGTTVLSLGLYIARTHAHVLDDVRAELTPLVNKITEVNANSGLTIDSLMQQLPSGFLIGLITALALSLLLENRVRSWMGFALKKPLPPTEAPASVMRQPADVFVANKNPGALEAFKVPDLFIWATTAAIFGAFYHHGDEWIETVSINALNVLAVAFFFQGLAVATQAFRAFKIAPFWRAIWYLILVVQLFLLVSLVGFADFWLDFRERLARKPAEPKKNFNS